MTDSELITAISKNDVSAKKQFYETYYPVLSGISIRYAKNKTQSKELLQNGMAHLLSNISNFK